MSFNGKNYIMKKSTADSILQQRAAKLRVDGENRSGSVYGMPKDNHPSIADGQVKFVDALVPKLSNKSLGLRIEHAYPKLLGTNAGDDRTSHKTLSDEAALGVLQSHRLSSAMTKGSGQIVLRDQMHAQVEGAPASPPHTHLERTEERAALQASAERKR